ncbi:MAG: hypothetical protein WC275_04720, partial [Bacilli bacterium]
ANNYQMNRNPFIDYPQWARIAYDPTYTGSGASNAPETSSVGANSDLVKDATLLSISLNTTNVKKEFKFNEKFTTQGLVVTGTYDNGITQRVSSFTASVASDTVLSTSGTQTITISVTHNEETKTATYDITVAPEEAHNIMGFDMKTIIIFAAVGVVVLILLLIIFVSLSKKQKKKVVKVIKKGAKKQVKKSTRKKK